MKSSRPINKLLFLDFDGVLHSTMAIKDELFCKVPLLNSLLTDRPCDVVISSSWRLHFDLGELRARLPAQISRLIIGRTGQVKTGKWPRYFEIKEFIGVHMPNANWRAIDDAILQFPEGCNELIQCNPNTGITQNEINKLINWLDC